MTEQEWIDTLTKEGYKDVTVCPNELSTEFGEHTHHRHTVHVVLEGELTIIDNNGAKTFRPGERFEFPAGTTHNAKCGPAGCKFLVGVKQE